MHAGLVSIIRRVARRALLRALVYIQGGPRRQLRRPRRRAAPLPVMSGHDDDGRGPLRRALPPQWLPRGACHGQRIAAPRNADASQARNYDSCGADDAYSRRIASMHWHTQSKIEASVRVRLIEACGLYRQCGKMSLSSNDGRLERAGLARRRRRLRRRHRRGGCPRGGRPAGGRGARGTGARACGRARRTRRRRPWRCP